MESQSSSDAGAARNPSLRPCHNCLHPCLPEQSRCPECGAFQRHAEEARPLPGVAGVLSFLIPGLGHFYLARPIRGLLWLGLAPVVWWWAIGSVRGTPFFLPRLEFESWRNLSFRGAVLLYHVLAAVHAIQQGQPREDTQRARTARSWLLRLGLAGIGVLFIYTSGLPRARKYWAGVFPVSTPVMPRQAPPVTPAAPKPFFSVNISGIAFLPNGDLKLKFDIRNTSPWTIEKGTLQVKSGDGKLYGSIALAYLGVGKCQKATVVADRASGRYATGFNVEAADIQTVDGLKECVVEYDAGCAVLRLLSVEPLEDGRSLATFQLYNLRSTAIPVGSMCAIMPVWVEKRHARNQEILVLPGIDAGGVGEAKLAFERELEGFEVDSRSNHLDGGMQRLDDARVLEYRVEDAPFDDSRSGESRSGDVPAKPR